MTVARPQVVVVTLGPFGPEASTVVTHDPAVGAQAQRMIRMRDGSIVADEAFTGASVHS